MSEEAFKLYERNCGEAGKFIVLEAGREKSDGTYEGVSMYGHYYVDANYDGTYVKIVSDDNYGLYQLWNNSQNKVLRLYLPEKIQSSLEAMVESKSEKAKCDVFNQFLQQCNKDGRNEVEYANGIYNNTNNYDYTKVISTTVPTKVSVLSIGDIILNPINTNYYLSTGIENDSSLVYVFQNDFKIYTKVSTTNLKIIPVISIKKDLLINGNGSIENPYIIK